MPSSSYLFSVVLLPDDGLPTKPMSGSLPMAQRLQPTTSIKRLSRDVEMWYSVGRSCNQVMSLRCCSRLAGLAVFVFKARIFDLLPTDENRWTVAFAIQTLSSDFGCSNVFRHGACQVNREFVRACPKTIQLSQCGNGCSASSEPRAKHDISSTRSEQRSA